MGTQWGWHIDQEDCPAMSLGERIRQLRKEAGWSQTELAERIAVDPGRVSKYEAGRMSPSPEALIRLAETLNVSIDYLLIDDIPADRYTPRKTHSATNWQTSPNSTPRTSPSSAHSSPRWSPRPASSHLPERSA